MVVIEIVDQPAPTPNGGPSMHDLVCADLASWARHESALVCADMVDRKQVGLARYGTILQAGNGRDPYVDAYQEVLDLLVYLRQALAEAGWPDGRVPHALEGVYLASMLSAVRLRRLIEQRSACQPERLRPAL